MYRRPQTLFPIPALLIGLFVFAGQVLGGYVTSSLSAGGYFLNSEDAREDKSFYRYEGIRLYAEKSGLTLNTVYNYSDFYNIRPNSYGNQHRLPIAEVTYTPPMGWVTAFGGRSFKPLIDRTFFYDGGGLSFQHKYASVEGFAGVAVPDYYQDGIFNSDPQGTAFGGRLKVTPIKNYALSADYLKSGDNDDGSGALELSGRVCRNFAIAGSSVMDFNSSAVSRADIAAITTLRKRDVFRLSFSMQDDDIDSTRYYVYLFNQAHSILSTGYYLHVTHRIQASLDYGLVMYDDFTGHLISSKLMAYGAYAKMVNKIQKNTNSLDVSGGYEIMLFKMLTLNAGGGWLSYTLSEDKEAQDAMVIQTGADLLLMKRLKLSVEYEYLSNPAYKSDNRVFIGMNYHFYQKF